MYGAAVNSFNPLDGDEVLAEIGGIALVILREAMDTGIDLFRRSRDLDPVGFADYSATTRANMLVDRMYPVMAALVDAADPEHQHLDTRRTDNQRALELYAGAYLYTKLKRVRDRPLPPEQTQDPELADLIDIEVTEYGMPKNVPTQRVLRQRSPEAFHVGRQLTLDHVPPVQVQGDARDRVCLVAGFDLDVTEDNLVRHRIGLYNDRVCLWHHWLHPLPLSAIATISSPLAEQVEALRQARAA